MTTIAAQISVDSRGPCALYIASDSRITWGKSQDRWDAGQKTFASSSSPDIFGFFGSAFFPTQVLNQVTRQIEAGILFDSDADAEERHGRWRKTICSSLENSSNPQVNDFSILHGAREGEGMNCSFRLWETKFNSSNQSWKDTEIVLRKDHSHFASVNGSGKSGLIKRLSEPSLQTETQTSRNAFQKLFQSIAEGDDGYSGGAPQIVGMFRVRNAQHFGMIWNKKRYFSGCKLVAGSNYQSIDWFNDKFERADGKTRERLNGAKRH